MSWSRSPWPSALRGAVGGPAARPPACQAASPWESLQSARRRPHSTPPAVPSANTAASPPLPGTVPPPTPRPNKVQGIQAREKQHLLFSEPGQASLLRPGQGSPRGRRGWEPCLASPLPLWVRSSLPFGSFPGLPGGRLWLHARDEGGYQN